MNYLKLFFLFLFFTPIIFASTVRIDDFDDLEVYAGNSTLPTEGIYFEKPGNSGVGNDAGNPLSIYMPFDSDSSSQDHENSVLFTDKTQIPTSSSAFIGFYIEATNNTTDAQFLNIAVKNSSDEYEAFVLDINDSSREIPASTASTVKLNISLVDLCNQFGDYKYCEGETSFEETIPLYVYLSDSIENDTQIDESEDGLFIDLKISDEIPENSYTIESVDRGDNQLIYNVSGGDDITQMGDNFFNILIFIYDGAVEQVEQYYGGSTAIFFQEVLDYSNEGEDNSDDDSEDEEINASFSLNSDDEEVDNGQITVSNLENGESYNLSIAKVNKFLFLSQLSASKVGSPQNIETFLTEQSCYLLSAGFQTNHYVLDYFREFRDSKLLTTELGTKFVQIYYDTAPKYTAMIYQSKTLSLIIRGLGYFFYMLFNFWFLFVSFAVVVLVRFKVNRLKYLK